MLCANVSAQSQAREVPDTVSDVTLTAVAWERPIPSLEVGNGGEGQEWMVPAFRKSSPIVYGGDRLVHFFTTDTTVEPQVRRNVAQVELPAEAKNVILLFFPTGQFAYQVHPVAVPAMDSFPGGHALVMNVSKQTVAVLAGEDTFRLEPGESRMVAGDRVKLKVKVAREQDGEWRVVASNLLALGPQRRLSVFITETDASQFHEVGEHGELLRSSPVKLFTVEN